MSAKDRRKAKRKAERQIGSQKLDIPPVANGAAQEVENLRDSPADSIVEPKLERNGKPVTRVREYLLAKGVHKFNAELSDEDHRKFWNQPIDSVQGKRIIELFNEGHKLHVIHRKVRGLR